MATTTVMLSNQALNDISSSTNAKVNVPKYSRESLSAGIVHFGVGNFHRSHQVSQQYFTKNKLNLSKTSIQFVTISVNRLCTWTNCSIWARNTRIGPLLERVCCRRMKRCANVWSARIFWQQLSSKTRQKQMLRWLKICEFIRNNLDESFFLKIFREKKFTGKKSHMKSSWKTN